MSHPQLIYQMLLDHCSAPAMVEQLLIGAVWTLCRTNAASGVGLAMSPGLYPRNLTWSGELTGKTDMQLGSWIYSWDPHQAAVALAAINSNINSRPLPESLHPISLPAGNLAVFDFLLPQLREQKVAVIGHYPGIERYQNQMELSILERQLQTGDLPDSACEFILPEADWVFLTASSIANKTLPRLAELSANAKTVLMGPSLPWLTDWRQFGIDYLAGIEILDHQRLQNTVAQGGGMKIFADSVRYRIAAL